MRGKVSSVVSEKGDGQASLHTHCAVAQVPTKVAVSIKAVPTKLARAINLLAHGDENGDLLIGDVFPKPEEGATEAAAEA